MIEMMSEHLPQTIVTVLMIAATFLEVSKIKVNPWSWVASVIGRALNHDVIQQMQRLDERMERLENRQDKADAAAGERAAISQRARILRFGDELLHDERHTKEHFDEILRDIKRYECYCAAHKEFENGTTVATTKYIKDTYSRLLESHDFL